MNKETKIVLAIKGEKALYLFKREYDDFTEVKFVVGWNHRQTCYRRLCKRLGERQVFRNSRRGFGLSEQFGWEKLK